MDFAIDFYAVGIAAVLYTIIFAVWYSKWLFGATWVRLNGLTESQLRKNVLWKRLGWNFLLGLCFAYFLAFFDASLQVTSVGDAMLSALTLWIGFVLPTQLFSVIWYRKPVRLFWIDAGYLLLSLLVMGGIIGA